MDSTVNFLQILILGLVQGAAELLPVSSSAHVIVAEKLMGLDPSSPEMTFLLVMLHTGTMFAVIVYFWNSWLDHYFSDAAQLWNAFKNIVAATAITFVVFFVLKLIIEKVFMHGQAKAEVEELFSNLPLIGGGLLAVGLLILYSGSSEEKQRGYSGIDVVSAFVIGAVQGLCLPFRGFSRSGGTISTGLLLGIERRQIEEFSFALAVVLTPFAVGRELWRLMKVHPEMTHGPALVKLLTPGLAGMVCSFAAGYVALKLLSRLLEGGRWKYFGYYCVVAAAVVFGLAHAEKTAASSAGTSAAPATTVVVAPDSGTNGDSAPGKLAPITVPGDSTDGMPPATNVFTSGTLSTTGTMSTNTNQPGVPPLNRSTNAAPLRALPVNPGDMTNSGSSATNTAPGQ